MAAEAAVNTGGQWVAGFHAVEIRIKAGEVQRLEIDRNRRDGRARQLLELAQRYEVAVERVPGRQLDERANGVAHQGVCAQLGQASQPTLSWSQCVAGITNPLILVLDEVEDPRNLGACLRVADGAGAQCVVVPKRRAAGLNTAARKTAAGAAESLPLVVVPNLSRCLDAMRADGIWLLGLDDGDGRSLYDEALNRPLALVLGNEGSGLRRLTRERCDAVVSLPMLGQVSSLNVSVAAGIGLYEVVRQRRAN